MRSVHKEMKNVKLLINYITYLNYGHL